MCVKLANETTWLVTLSQPQHFLTQLSVFVGQPNRANVSLQWMRVLCQVSLNTASLMIKFSWGERECDEWLLMVSCSGSPTYHVLGIKCSHTKLCHYLASLLCRKHTSMEWMHIYVPPLSRQQSYQTTWCLCKKGDIQWSHWGWHWHLYSRMPACYLQHYVSVWVSVRKAKTM